MNDNILIAPPYESVDESTRTTRTTIRKISLLCMNDDPVERVMTHWYEHATRQYYHTKEEAFSVWLRETGYPSFEWYIEENALRGREEHKKRMERFT